MPHGLLRILIIFLLIYLAAGVVINLTAENKSLKNLKEDPMLILEVPFNYILEMVSKT